MQKRRLGHSSIDVAPFCFGGNVFGWTADEAASFALLDAFVDAGFDFIDTADMYAVWAPGGAGGESETIIGRWFKRSGKRDKVVIATKVGMKMGDGSEGLSQHHISASVEASLRRLQTDRIDLYYAHCDDPGTPMEETLGAFARLVEDGKVRILGASNFEAPRLAQALDVSRAAGLPRYEVLQPKYNLYDRAEYEGPLQSVVVENGLSAAPYKGLANGFLTGKYRSGADAALSVRGPRSTAEYLNERGLSVLHAVDAVASRHGATPAQVALAWLLVQPGVAAPIASTTNTKQLLELAQAVDLVLDAEDLAVLSGSGTPSRGMDG